MNVKIYSAIPNGISGELIDVEISFLPDPKQSFAIIGLNEYDARNCAARIKSALLNNGINLPTDRKIVVNLAPAHIKKIGAYFDLAITAGILQLLNIINIPKSILKETVFLGELSIDGTINPIIGALSIAFDLKSFNKKRLLIAKKNANECYLIKDIKTVSIESINNLCSYFKNKEYESYEIQKINITSEDKSTEIVDMVDVKGQYQAKRALEICAAGKHNILMIGSPGSGKTMLAKRLPTIMNELSYDEILETSRIHSVAGELNNKLINTRPFRSPHHTASSSGIMGGGHKFIQPGDISLAHNGILFLDELTEFRKSILDCLRQPLEENKINIRRTNYQVTLPADFLLVGAANPCPCGFWGDKNKQCKCSPLVRQNYLNKLSGPLLDRIDIQVAISSLNYKDATNEETCETSQQIALRVKAAIDIQLKRQNKMNGTLTSTEIDKFCKLDEGAQKIMAAAFEKLKLTMRSYHKMIKISRTIADLAGKELIEESHIKEALSYRGLDKYLI